VTTAATVSAALARSGLVPLEAKILLAHVLGRERAWIAAHGEAIVPTDELKRFDALTRRRHTGEPVAYLTGEREFYGLTFAITPDVLIPRPESELLVELALERVGVDSVAEIVDLGTGSGALALVIARQRPHAHVTAVDRSGPALQLARRNGERLGIGNVEFVESDWFDALGDRHFAMAVANPPYVADDDPHLREGDLRFEPEGALRGGVDGLGAIRSIVEQAPRHLDAGGWLLLEHGHDQAQRVRALLTDAGFAQIQSRRDLAGIERATLGQLAFHSGMSPDIELQRHQKDPTAAG